MFCKFYGFSVQESHHSTTLNDVVDVKDIIIEAGNIFIANSKLLYAIGESTVEKSSIMPGVKPISHKAI